MIIDADLIKECADPRLSVGIVQMFVEEIAAPDANFITLKSGSKTYAIPRPKTADEALKIAKEYVGSAVVRVGVTQYPAGIGVQSPNDLSVNLFDPCENLRMGTAMFSKVYRMATKFYGGPRPEAFEDAMISYASGYFEGKSVFHAEDPGNVVVWEPDSEERLKTLKDRMGIPAEEESAGEPERDVTEDGGSMKIDPASDDQDPNKASMRIDLSGIKSHNIEPKGAGN